MTRAILWLCACCVALATFAQANNIKRFVPLPRDSCPQRPIDFWVYYEKDAEFSTSISSFIHHFLTETNTLDWKVATELNGYEGRDDDQDPSNQRSSFIPSDLAWLISQRVLDTNDGHENRTTVFVVRDSRNGAEHYVDAMLSAHANGLRVITIDYNCTKAQAIATLTASEPRDKNALVFNSLVDFVQHAPLIAQLLRKDIGRKCVVSERMTVHTFDGAAYTHTGIGDYVLLRQFPVWTVTYSGAERQASNFEVQVRKTQCDDNENQACITTVGFRFIYQDTNDQVSWTISYDRKLNDVVVTADGSVLPTEFFMNNFGQKFHTIEPDIGLHLDLHFPVAVNGNYGIIKAIPQFSPKVTIDFFKEKGREPVIVIEGDSLAWAKSAGMCGTFDSCFANEFVTADGKLVGAANESAPTWRVHGGESIFEHERYFVNADDQLLPLTLRQPLIPADWKSVDGEGKTLVNDAGVDLLNKDALYTLCNDYCRFHCSGVAAIDLNDGAVCAQYCDDQAEDLAGLSAFDLYGEYNDTNLPAVALGTFTDGKNVKMIASIGGSYVFEVRSQDCCGYSDAANVTVNVKCLDKLSVKIESDGELVLRSGTYLMPHIRLTAKLSGDDIENAHVSWRLVSGPENGDEFTLYPEFYDTPKLLFSHSLTPEFHPLFVGNYTLEVVAFDGCTRAFDRINISVPCIEMADWSMTYNSGSSTWDGMDFNEIAVNTIAPCMLVAVPDSLEVNTIFELSLPSPQDPLLGVEYEDTEEYNIYWHTETPITTNVTVTVENTTDADIPGSWTTIDNVNGITRIEARIKTDKYFVEGSVETTEVISEYRFIHSIQCELDVQQDTNGIKFKPSKVANVITADQLPEWANTTAYRRVASLNAPFGFGVCAGTYHANQTFQMNAMCRNTTLEADFHVTCDAGWVGPYAKTLSPCFPIVYNYDSHLFDPVTLEGTDSLDHYRSSYMKYKWTPISWPATTIPAHFMPATTTTNTLTVGASTEGEYVFELAVTNGCGVDKEQYTLTAECAGAVTTVLICPATEIVFNYTDHVMNHAFLNGSLSTTAATNSAGNMATLFYMWNVLAPDGKYTTTNAAEYFDMTNLAAAGTYHVNLTVTDFCRMDAKSCTFTLNCPNVLTANGAINITNPVINPITGTSEPINVIDLTTSNELYAVEWSLYRDLLGNGTYNDLSDQWSDHNFTFTVSVSGNYMLELVVRDGCKTSKKQLLFTAMCASNVLTPYIRVTPGTELYVENSTVFTANSALSTGGEWEGATVPLVASKTMWTLVRPDGTISTHDTATWIFSPLNMAGEYNLSLTIGDICKTTTRSVNLYVFCASQVKPEAHADATTVTWKGTKFPLVTLDGENSDLTESVRLSVSYTWYFLNAPANSVFKGVENIHYETVVANQTIFEDWKVTGTAGFEQRNYTTRKQVLTTKVWKYVTQTRLVSPSTNYEAFGACFRPDVPGTYKLQLAMETPCNAATDTVTINAVCNGAPTISAVIPSEANMWDAMVLDASGTMDPDGDVLSYRWNIELCNGTYNYNDILLNSRSNKALFTPENPGNYCVSLEVSDGCSNASSTWIFEVKCNNTLLTPPRKLAIDAKFDGLGVQVVSIAVEEQKGITRDQKWLNTHEYTWTLVGFTPADKYKADLTGGQIAGIVIGVVVFVAIIAAAIVGLIWFIRKHPVAAAATIPPPIASATETEKPEVELTPAAATSV